MPYAVPALPLPLQGGLAKGAPSNTKDDLDFFQE